MDKKQVGAFSEEEMQIIKNFAESREDATLILRNHFLQLGLRNDELAFLSSLSQATRDVLRRVLIPQLTREVPLTLQATMYSRLAFIEQFSEEGAYLHIRINDLIIEYFEQQFARISEPAEGGIVLKELPVGGATLTTMEEKEARVIGMNAYNKIIPLVEERVHWIQVMSESPKLESGEEAKKRMEQNSTK